MTPFWPDEAASDAIIRWIGPRLPGYERGIEYNRVMGVASGKGDLVAAIIFTRWSPEAGTIELTVFSEQPRWLSREVIRTALTYAFGPCGCQMVLAAYPLDRKSRALCTKFGASEVIIPRLFGRHTDGAIATLTDDQWAAHPLNIRCSNG